MRTSLRPPPHRPDGAGIAYLVRSWPRLSQTFISSEVLALESQGVDIRVMAFVNPREPLVQPELASLRAPVVYLDESVPERMDRVVRAHLKAFARAPGRYLRALAVAVVAGKEHESGYSNYSRFRCFTLATCAAGYLTSPDDGTGRVQHLHAHFAHDPTFVALLVHLLTGVSYSFTTHARDLYQIQRRALIRRAERATHVVTCCRANEVFLRSTLPQRLRSRVRLIHHGVDSEAFRPGPPKSGSGAPRVVAVGRLVAKKGFEDLIRACGVVARTGQDFTCLIYGDGPQRAELSAVVESEELGDRVHLMGALTQRELVGVYQGADVFALTPFVTGDGDRDGIPNVLLEAMSCGLPVLTTDAGGISELVVHESNGLLLPPRDVDGIAAGLHALLRNAEFRTRLGESARATVAKGFDSKSLVAELVSIFRERAA
jgi:glycosyltransferase involved in cell wall biosynthesis